MWDDDPIDDVPDCGFDDDHDPENEWVLDCGLEGCCMPGYHFRYECHTPEMIEAYAAECSEDPTTPTVGAPQS